MNRKLKVYRPPTDDEIACCAFVIFAREEPEHAREVWRQAEAQLTASRQHDAGLFPDYRRPSNATSSRRMVTSGR